MTATGPEQIAFMEQTGMPLSTVSHKEFTEVEEPSRLGYTSVIDFVPGLEPYQHLTFVTLERTESGTDVEMEIEPLHDDVWTERIQQGRANELDNLTQLLTTTRTTKEQPMAHVQRFDHIGITVADLASATAFFVGLGLEVEGTGSVEGEFVETVCGIPGAHCEITMLRPPDGGSRLELASFVTPDHVPGSPSAMANELGLRNVSFEVGDLQAAVDAVAADGFGLVAGIGEYENSVRMAYVRGPEGIIVSLFEQIG